jgi:diguanylate cyclase (GGDEF)-like protein/PAS domain S-box-containing protein
MTRKSTSLLLVEDNPVHARLLREMLNEQNSHDILLKHVECMREAEEHLAAYAVDIILLDLGLPDAQGLEAVRRAHAVAPSVPLVVLTGLDDESLAAQALQEGAQDHLIKGEVDSRGLLRALLYAIERKTMEEALFAEKERAQVTLNCIGDAVVCTDIAGNITFINVIAETMTGWSRQEASGQPIADVFRIVGARNEETILNPGGMPERINRTAQPMSACVLIRRDGFEIPIEDSASTIHDRNGRAAGTVVIFRDVTAARATSLEMTHSAQHDFLTGLPNRMLLNDRIGQAIALATRHRKQIAVLFLDLDGFKNINDSLGHLIGDKLLQSIAKRLVGCVRGSDTVSRQGGDEFVVLLSEAEPWEDAAVTARRILHEVAEAHSIDGHTLRVTTSIGVSVFPDDGLDAETLIKNADAAMYEAKSSGHHTYRFFKPATNVRTINRFAGQARSDVSETVSVLERLSH